MCPDKNYAKIMEWNGMCCNKAVAIHKRNSSWFFKFMHGMCLNECVRLNAYWQKKKKTKQQRNKNKETETEHSACVLST